MKETNFGETTVSEDNSEDNKEASPENWKNQNETKKTIESLRSIKNPKLRLYALEGMASHTFFFHKNDPEKIIKEVISEKEFIDADKNDLLDESHALTADIVYTLFRHDVDSTLDAIAKKQMEKSMLDNYPVWYKNECITKMEYTPDRFK